ncbi:MFS transporter [Legionella maioricensis]|uniref:MFS transporter n=1 Tax=Legionella maioricensis TaxID=2896528 RepID=A0A9X2D382_9GAMM|nr:MFS transporter [Legionella maioricensis]MCL9685719.1 MFS transporter [Legionella maioricensis]MCL9688994.1 MFS transporter [Legionella maioricensis]
MKSVLFSAFLGTLIEVYDFSVFPFFIPILSEVFFSSYEKSNALNFTILAYVVSYFVKPISAIVCGYLMDYLGRRRVFIFTTVLMTVATSSIALMPSSLMSWGYGTLLIICRVLQGVAISGEFSTAIIMAVEEGKKRSALVGCIAFIGGATGLLLANLSVLIVLHSIPHEQMIHFGWRIPFLIGAIGCISLLYIRSGLKHDFVDSKKPYTFKSLFKANKRALWLVFIVSSLSASAFYITFVFLPTLLSTLLALHTHQDAILMTLAALILYVVALPLGGILADRIGILRQIKIAITLYLLFSYMTFNAIPALGLLGGMVILVLFSIIQALLNSALPVFIVEQFEFNQRGKALGVSYNISLALFGGLLPFIIATYNNHLNPGIPITICAVLCLIFINFKEVKHGYLRSKFAD